MSEDENSGGGDSNDHLLAIAEANIGLYFLRGQGVVQSLSEAEKYLRKSINSGKDSVLVLMDRIVKSSEPHAEVLERIIYDEIGSTAK